MINKRFNISLSKRSITRFNTTYTIITLILGSILSANTSANTLSENCDINANIIGARYTIEKQDLKTKETVTSTFNLWRTENQVAHEKTSSQITDIWDRGHSGRLKLSRYFDEHQRGIEYQPEDVKKGNKNWDMKYQLIDNKLLDKLTLQEKKLSACKLEEHYSSATSKTPNEEKSAVVWLANLNLLKKYEEVHKHDRITWTLNDIITDSKQVRMAISAREAYKTTDYIDIGDNESDPFLLKMINLGFIEHSDNGFYDANGNSMSGGHSGHHH